jgi:hypothetical protein
LDYCSDLETCFPTLKDLAFERIGAESEAMKRSSKEQGDFSGGMCYEVNIECDGKECEMSRKAYLKRGICEMTRSHHGSMV